MSALAELLAHDRKTRALAEVAGRLGWDQETMMPRGAAEQRGEEFAALESLAHAHRTDPRIGEWLGAVGEGLDEVEAAQVHEIRREFERARRIPERLAAELARATSVAQGVWADARANEDFGAFAPNLSEVVALRREEAAALAEGTGADAYDALLDEYEPGASGAELQEMFDAMRPRLVALADRIAGAPAPRALSGHFDEAVQEEFSRELAVAFGYDLSRGRIDKAVHPFSSGSGTDVRITMRTDPADPFNCIYSTIHETGHAAYEQNIDDAFGLTALGRGVSMGVHESQSRIYENQIGRGRDFVWHLHARMTDRFGALDVADAEGLYAAVNRVAPGYIRTEADEVHYNLHVMLRFDLERQLVAGALEARDLPEAWNARFAADFGREVDKPSNGVLQDVHWSAGLFGYFPTYSLGNVYAGCLHAALLKDVPDLGESLSKGDTAPATGWLRDRLQRHGSLRPPRDAIRHATGAEPSVEPLLGYLEAKFADLYGF